MDDLYLAYYTGTGTWQDRLIRWATRSRFSHVELVMQGGGASSAGLEFTAQSWSSSARDGGVRGKLIRFRPKNWQFQKVQPWYDPERIEAAQRHAGAKYDFKGLLLSQVFALHRDDPDRWFCSEFCADALGLSKPYNYAPEDLYNAVFQLNWAYLDGRSTVMQKRVN